MMGEVREECRTLGRAAIWTQVAQSARPQDFFYQGAILKSASHGHQKVLRRALESIPRENECRSAFRPRGRGC